MILSGCAAGPQRAVCFKEGCVNVELAQTPAEWQMGLSKRTSLDKDSGMLFIFPIVDQYQFWMKDTYMPLDIVWINESNYVIHIEKNLQPCKADPCPSYGPADKSRYVLELNAGKADELKLKEGSSTEFRFKL